MEPTENQLKRKPILLVDFDGVLHSYTSGWRGAGIVPDAPVEGAKQFLQEVVKEFHVNVYSARTGQTGGRDAMRRWCHGNFGEELTDRLEFPEKKPGAFLTLDDRCVCFSGKWPEVKDLLGFKPWNKRVV